MKVGFTGTRKGLTESQYQTVQLVLSTLDPEELHHGNCKGADVSAHIIFDHLFGNKGIVIAHPGPIGAMSAAYNSPPLHEYTVRDPKPYLERNKDIVNETDVLIACPPNDVEELRSGTWSTVRYARKQGRQIYIVYPNRCMRHI